MVVVSWLLARKVESVCKKAITRTIEKDIDILIKDIISIDHKHLKTSMVFMGRVEGGGRINRW